MLHTQRIIRTVSSRINGNRVLTDKTNLVHIGRRRLGLHAEVSEDNENLVVKRNELTDKFPLVWLRDNCTCENCLHKLSQSRIINWREFDVDVKVKSVKTKGENNVEIRWHDDHTSNFSWDWLEKRSFLKANQERYLNEVYMPRKRTWHGSEFFDILKKYEYNDIKNNDEVLYHWLRDLAIYGVSMLKNVPENENECRKISEKIAFVKKTHYGEDFFVVAKEGTNNVAYLSNPLQLHTDLPYYDYKPGVTLLHCLVQTKNKGGENLLTDAFYVAEQLRRTNKEVFDLLTQTEINWSDIGEEDGVVFHKIHRAPVISLDRNENIQSVRHSIPQRDSHFTVEIQNVVPWYRALKVFIREAYNCTAFFKTQPGDVLTFDNTRMLHGRIGYDDTKDVRRFLVGNFVDWDEIYSKIRVLSKRFLK